MKIKTFFFFSDMTSLPLLLSLQGGFRIFPIISNMVSSIFLVNMYRVRNSSIITTQLVIIAVDILMCRDCNGNVFFLSVSSPFLTITHI